MKTRAAKTADIPVISELIKTLVINYILPTCSAEGGQILLKSMSEQSITNYFELGYQYTVALCDDQIVAVIGIKNNHHLYHLFVAQSHQGLGLSNLLWQQAKKQAIAQGNPGFFTVNSALNAADLYRKWGFIDTDEVRERSGIRDIPMLLEL
jgi:N-acetylglutamate synthase-like GNAT family acetyltransferase